MTDEKKAAKYFLAFQGSYKQTQIALIFGDLLLDYFTLDSLLASADLLPTIDQLLQKHQLKLEDLTGVAIDYGPGAFTSLRVILTTANALAWAGPVNLWGSSGLRELALFVANQPTTGQEFPYIASILNAYSQEVYLAIWNRIDQNWLIFEQYGSILDCSQTLKNLQHPCILTGNAAETVLSQITKSCPENKNLFLESEITLTVPAHWIASQAWKAYKNGFKGEKQLKPYYIKSGFKTA